MKKLKVMTATLRLDRDCDAAILRRPPSQFDYLAGRQRAVASTRLKVW